MAVYQHTTSTVIAARRTLVGLIRSSGHFLVCRNNSACSPSLQFSSQSSSLPNAQGQRDVRLHNRDDGSVSIQTGLIRLNVLWLTIQIRSVSSNFGCLGLVADDGLAVPIHVAHIVYVLAMQFALGIRVKIKGDKQSATSVYVWKLYAWRSGLYIPCARRLSRLSHPRPTSAPAASGCIALRFLEGLGRCRTD